MTGIAHPSRTLRVAPGFDIRTFDPASSPGFTGSHADAVAHMEAHSPSLDDMQERLFASTRGGANKSILLVLQGLDTAGKGGIVRHVMGIVDPQGVTLHSFGVPTATERRHHYLWRIRRALPPAGHIGVFDRSHYEDVLVARVENLVPQAVWERRYQEINRFERTLASRGIKIIKCALLISYDEQARRLGTRLARADKQWKFTPSDMNTRLKWPAYQDAYQAVFEHTSTPCAPWHVIPADKKWFARLAVFELLREALHDLNLSWPPATYDVAAETERLAASANPPWLAGKVH